MHADVATIANALDEAQLLLERHGAHPATVSGITDDSRRVTPGSLFVAVRGTERDGHDYLDAAARAGASLAILQDAGRTSLPSLVVNDGRRAAAIAGAAAYGWPARQLQIVGVTGEADIDACIHLNVVGDCERNAGIEIGQIGTAARARRATAVGD